MGRLVRRVGWGVPPDTVGLCSRPWAPVPSSPISEIVPSFAFRSKIAPWARPTDRNHPSPQWPTFQPAHLVRVLSPDEIERMLAEHRLYIETEYHQGHRANFAS